MFRANCRKKYAECVLRHRRPTSFEFWRMLETKKVYWDYWKSLDLIFQLILTDVILRASIQRLIEKNIFMKRKILREYILSDYKYSARICVTSMNSDFYQKL